MSAATHKLAIQLEAVDALIAEFRKKWEFEPEDEQMIETFKQNLAASNMGKKGRKNKKDAGEPKAKRPPSEYNLFVQSKRQELTDAGFKGKDLIREAAKLWNERERPEKEAIA